MDADRVVHHGLQFPDVSGEMIGGQQFGELIGRGWLFLPQAVRRFFEEMIQQNRQVFGSLPKRRDLKPVAAKPVVEILAESTGAAGGIQVLIGRHHHAGIRSFGKVGTQGQIFPVLQQPQELDL